MEHPIIQIKNAITALLKGIDPDTDVFYEEIKGTGLMNQKPITS